MLAQEEELRQNQEEMQATQEEMERKIYEMERAISQEQIRAGGLEAVEDPIVTVDRDGIIQMANAAITRKLGYPRDFLVQRAIAEVIPAVDGNPAQAAADAVELKHRDGSDHTATLSVGRFEVKNPPYYALCISNLN